VRKFSLVKPSPRRDIETRRLNTTKNTTKIQRCAAHPSDTDSLPISLRMRAPREPQIGRWRRQFPRDAIGYAAVRTRAKSTRAWPTGVADRAGRRPRARPELVKG
jgi:hypothetical protein